MVSVAPLSQWHAYANISIKHPLKIKRKCVKRMRSGTGDHWGKYVPNNTTTTLLSSFFEHFEHIYSPRIFFLSQHFLFLCRQIKTNFKKTSTPVAQLQNIWHKCIIQGTTHFMKDKEKSTSICQCASGLECLEFHTWLYLSPGSVWRTPSFWWSVTVVLSLLKSATDCIINIAMWNTVTPGLFSLANYYMLGLMTLINI